ncbi:MAG: hypothetical protein ABSC77_01945 [Terracidiphilus sp.]|jgi:hypothetical protein
MSNLRTWNRREFSVTPNGYFTVLRPTGWFSTLRLPGGFRYRVGLSEETEFSQAHQDPTPAPPPDQEALIHADIQETAILSQSMIPSTHYRLMRPALIVLVAIAITLIILFWLMDYVPEIVKQRY